MRRRAADAVAGVRFEGVPGARPAPGVLEAVAEADRIVLAPSNPFVSLDPILAVDGLRDAVRARRADVVAVAPLIGGRAVKGPLLEMLASLGRRADVAGAAECVADVAGAYLIDPADQSLAADVEALGLRAIVAPALLADPGARAAAARAVLA